MLRKRFAWFLVLSLASAPASRPRPALAGGGSVHVAVDVFGYFE